MITTDMRKPVPKTLNELYESNYDILIWNDFLGIFYQETISGYFWAQTDSWQR
jgi:hypothetical protein